MATSFALIALLGLLSGALFERIKLPGLLGMIIVGGLIGPYGFSLLSEDILRTSSDLRNIALIVILLRAGLGIEKKVIKKVGKPAIKLSFIPGILEGLTIAFLSVQLFDFSFIQGGILGFIIAAVSPAVIVPAMLDLIDRGCGQEKNIPTLILAGASIDDVFAVTIFSAFLGIYGGGDVNIGTEIFTIPLSIILGVIIGLMFGWILIKVFQRFDIPSTQKMLFVLSAAILLTTFEKAIETKIEIAGLLGVMAIGFILFEKMPAVGKQLASTFNEVWIFAQVLLFVLVGAQVNIGLALDAGLKGIILIGIGLLARSIGVLLSLIGTELNKKEKLFSIIAYIPKATVQAAIGAVPLAMGVESGDLILSLAVLSIVLTAPLGAILIKATGDRLLA
ncbi:cation:proton antiporter [Dolosigranulum pigrum]|uniref:cation:proton antiporter n=1 Tax=Dolosigranulum pigrum TaxID=29394 RepID=UPI000DC2638F|nr:cation:proton antiporter [Dolosigranulum pigrum]QJS95914.1 sodium:proton antiporter [Dolosigranulum pigrum]QTJ44939.1 sodium:proton antiporter [Dolosigranulum pigrum]